MENIQILSDVTKQYKNQALLFLQNLIQTPSVNGAHPEKEIIDLIRQEAESLGLDAQIFAKDQDRPNLYIGSPDSFDDDKSVLFVAHADTVPEGRKEQWKHDPFSGEIVENKIYGRGAIDCKGGIATSLYALKALKDTGSYKKAKMVVCVDEESGANSEIGLRYVLENGLKASGAIYAYGGEIHNSIIIGHRGLLRVWVEAHGELAHSGHRDWQNKTKGASAIDAIVNFLSEVQNYNKDLSSVEHEYFPGYHPIITPTLIEGGAGESLVPDYAKVLLDIRTLPNYPNKEIFGKLARITDSLSKDKIHFTTKIKVDIPPALSNPDSAIVQSAKKALQEVYKVSGNITLRGSGPANEAWMLIENNIPTVVGFGPVGSGFHGVDEYAEIDSIERSIKALVQIVQDA